jgi:Delta7-sterol 5-desaturase
MLSLTATVAAFYVGCTTVGLLLGTLAERVGRRRIWQVPVPATQRAHEVRGNITFVLVCIVTSTAALAADVARFGDDSAGRVVGTFMAMFVAFQAYYYLLHRALHLPALVRFHRHHHESRVTSAWSGQSTSLVEALGWMGGYVALPILLSFLTPLSFVGVVAYLAFNVVGNIVGHANVELVPPNPLLRWSSLSSTVFTYHALHHARWTGHYGFASTWADRLFRTEWPDWMTLHRQVWAGSPMTSLKARGEDDSVRVASAP